MFFKIRLSFQKKEDDKVSSPFGGFPPPLSPAHFL